MGLTHARMLSSERDLERERVRESESECWTLVNKYRDPPRPAPTEFLVGNDGLLSLLSRSLFVGLDLLGLDVIAFIHSVTITIYEKDQRDSSFFEASFEDSITSRSPFDTNMGKKSPGGRDR